MINYEYFSAERSKEKSDSSLISQSLQLNHARGNLQREQLTSELK